MTTTRVIFLGDGDAASERSCYRYRIGETVVALYLAYRVIGGNGDWPISIMYGSQGFSTHGPTRSSPSLGV